MLVLHMSGSPLTATQAELTYLQRQFLVHAINERDRRAAASAAAARQRR
jgi:hypothetical protein